MELTACPVCGLPAEVEAWGTALGTDGVVPHVRTRCVVRHWLLLPRDMVPELRSPERRDTPSAGHV
jgi:hypothetical protein